MKDIKRTFWVRPFTSFDDKALKWYLVPAPYPLVLTALYYKRTS